MQDKTTAVEDPTPADWVAQEIDNLISAMYMGTDIWLEAVTVRILKRIAEEGHEIVPSDVAKLGRAVQAMPTDSEAAASRDDSLTDRPFQHSATLRAIYRKAGVERPS